MRRDATQHPGVASDACISWPPPPLQEQSVMLFCCRCLKQSQVPMGLTRWRWATVTKPHMPQTPQVTRNDIIAASTLNTSCSFANIAARGEALRYTQGAYVAYN